MLRLIADVIILQDGTQQTTLANRPSRQEQYIAFRQRALHLSKLNERGHLTITSIIYEEPWPYDDGTQISADELAVAFENGYRWLTHHAQDPPVLSRRIVGHMLVSNYDPANRALAQRHQLNQNAQRHPQNLVMIDVDPNFPGGEFPCKGGSNYAAYERLSNFLHKALPMNPSFLSTRIHERDQSHITQSEH